MTYEEAIVKRIILVRHATAARRSASGDDFDRPLRKRGRKEARAVAAWCAEYLGVPDLMLTSKAARSVQTAIEFADVIGYRRRVVADQGLYDLTGSEHLLELLGNLKDTVDTAMVFGHDPVFTEFAADMAPPFDQQVPKCGVVVIDTRRRKWSTLRIGDGTVFAFQHPKALEAARAADGGRREEVAQKIAAAVAEALTELGVELDEDDSRRVARAAKRLARRLAAPKAGEGRAE